MEEKKERKKLPKWFLPAVATVVVVGCISFCFNKKEMPEAEDVPSQTQEVTKREEKEAENRVKVFDSIATIAMSSEEMLFTIDDIVLKWENSELSSEEALNKLKVYEKVRFEEVVAIVNEKIARITLEMNASKAHEIAEMYFAQGEFLETLTKLTEVPGEYSGYDSVKKLYNSCVKGVLDKVKEPYSVEEYEQSIKYIEDCLGAYIDNKLIKRKGELESELVELKAVLEIIQKAADLYDAQSYEEAFAMLAIGLVEYPENERIENSLVEFHNHFIIQTQLKVAELCKAEEYKEALAVIDEAILEYDCQELQDLRVVVREEKNVLYKLKNQLVAKFKYYVQEEEFSAKKVANEAGVYILKSGEKIILGDYSEEDVTVLALTGNVVASAAGVDAFMDIRDLIYDVTHWGEEEYFVARLAVDVVALIPVVGMIKYLDHCKAIDDIADTTIDVVDSVSDVGKNTDASVDAAESLIDTAKTLDVIADTADNSKDIANTSVMAKQIAKNSSKGYEYIKTINAGLLGQNHPVTGVPFELKQLVYSTGEMKQGVFPVFESLNKSQIPMNKLNLDFINDITPILNASFNLLLNKSSLTNGIFSSIHICINEHSKPETTEYFMRSSSLMNFSFVLAVSCFCTCL